MTANDQIYLIIVLATFGAFSAALLHITWIEARAARHAKVATPALGAAKKSFGSAEHA